jgi:CelD/BcsL family acetyltransferase involved in cellulose biosynthesis
MSRIETSPTAVRAPKVTVLRTETELEGLRTEWNRLLSRSAVDSPFLSWEWASSWWSAYGAGRKLHILRVDNDDLVGIVPLFEDELRLMRPLIHTALALIGDGSDYLDCLSLRGHEESTVDAMFDHLLGKGDSRWDLVRLREVPALSPHISAIERRARGLGWHWSSVQVPCARIDLPPSWEDYLRMLKPRMRTKVRSVSRELEQRFSIRYDRCSDPGDLEPRLQSLYELHNRRWDAEGKPGVFHSPAKRRFYALMSRRFLDVGWLRFYSLQAGGRYVAHQFCFERGNRIFLLQEGLDPEWFAHGAGNALRAYVMRDCIQRGIQSYDFLAGVTQHKLSWGATVHFNARVTAGPRSVRNTILFSAWNARRIAKRFFRPDAPPENG